jgi:hypothetical protein
MLGSCFSISKIILCYSTNSLKHTPYILRDSFRLLSIIDIIEFLEILSRASLEKPDLLLTDLSFPIAEPIPSQAELIELAKNFKRKRAYKPVAETVLPFGGIYKFQEPPKRIRFQRRGGVAMVTTQPKRQKSFAIVSKEEQLKRQRAALELASEEARVLQRKLDQQSTSSREGTRSGGKDSQDNPIGLGFDQTVEPLVPSIIPTESQPTFLSPMSECLEHFEESPSPLLSQTEPTNLPTSPPSQIVHINLSLSTVSIIPPPLSPSPSRLPVVAINLPQTPPRPMVPLLSDHDESYEDDFESEVDVQSRTSSRSSRRCLTPAQAHSRPMSRRSSKSSDSVEIRSPSRPDGPMPSNRRSFREYT